ncbi:MAG: undecaprenyl/decaprenyl-phosphate alpha-N-acetylglucosaminyl 1-phosphate transferase [Bacteroidaceae bacterium]|nr:undecaprenyl/decaprenyl-phosphate alpha-N-acetylglucosaminyl 1-phosphate transferase [Bacteroidaceae bacterium]
MYTLISILVPALSALLAVRWIYFKILKLAKEKGLVDNPDARKLQKFPVPVLGGLAVFFGVTFGMLTGCALYYTFNEDIIGQATEFTSTRLIQVMLAMSVMLYTGSLDDILGLSPRTRFVIEILVIFGIVLSSGACMDSLHGLWGVHDFSWWMAVPLTVFAGVGIINAVNMVDGVNGLSSGLCMTCSALFGVVFLYIGDIANAILAFTMVASLLPFFVHNVFGDKSRMFIGDAGTMIMGILMTWFVICIISSGGYASLIFDDVCIVAMVLAFMSVPVADTLRVMTMRVFKGRSPFSPDKTHLHHAFVAMGVSHSITALSIILINLAVVGTWYVAVKTGASLECQLYSVIIVAAILVWGSYIFLEHESRSSSRKAQWLRNFSIRTHLGRKEWWQRFTYFLDAPEFDEHERKNLRNKLERKFLNSREG